MTEVDDTRGGSGRVLVTGATGLVGNNVARQLVARGTPVRVLIRPGSDPRVLQDLELEVACGDVTDRASVAAAMRGVRAVVHAAGCVQLGWRHAALHEAINHQGTRHVALAARAEGARLLHVSTINALGMGTPRQAASEQWTAAPNIPCPYVLSKQAGEAAVQEQMAEGLDAVVVYPGLMFGPWDWKPSSGRMLLQVARSFTPMAPSGGISVSDARDVAAAILTALDTAPAGRTYVLAGHNLTYLKLWQHIADIAGGSRPLCRSGPLLRIALGRGGDFWGWLTGNEPDVNSAAIKLSDGYHYFDSSRAEQELGYRIRPVSESLRDAWQWFHEQGYVSS